MKVIVKKDRDLAFYSFFIRLTLEKEKHSAAFDFITLPDGLVEKADKLKDLPLGTYLDAGRVEIWKQINNFFDDLWLKCQPELDGVMQKIVSLAEHEKWVVKKIEQITGASWPYEEVIIYPSILTWAGTQKNKIRVGITPPHFIEKDFIPVLLHELIHVNTSSIALNLQHGNDADEIADTLLVNKILWAMKEELGLVYRAQRLAVPLRKYDSLTETFRTLRKEASSFKELAEKIDKLLVLSGHTPAYPLRK